MHIVIVKIHYVFTHLYDSLKVMQQYGGLHIWGGASQRQRRSPSSHTPTASRTFLTKLVQLVRDLINLASQFCNLNSDLCLFSTCLAQ